MHANASRPVFFTHKTIEADRDERGLQNPRYPEKTPRSDTPKRHLVPHAEKGVGASCKRTRAHTLASYARRKRTIFRAVKYVTRKYAP